MELQIKKEKTTTRAGQYIFICCPEVSYFQWHPFTLTRYVYRTYPCFCGTDSQLARLKKIIFLSIFVLLAILLVHLPKPLGATLRLRAKAKAMLVERLWDGLIIL